MVRQVPDRLVTIPKLPLRWERVGVRGKLFCRKYRSKASTPRSKTFPSTWPSRRLRRVKGDWRVTLRPKWDRDRKYTFEFKVPVVHDYLSVQPVQQLGQHFLRPLGIVEPVNSACPPNGEETGPIVWLSHQHLDHRTSARNHRR